MTPDLPFLMFKTLMLYALHEHQLGEVTEIKVNVSEQELWIRDNGRGMGFDRVLKGIPYVSLVCGQLNDELIHNPGFQVQLQGMGLSWIVACARTFTLTGYRKGHIYQLGFEHGQQVGGIQPLEETTEQHGTHQHLTLYPEQVFPLEHIHHHLQILRQRYPDCQLMVG